MREKREREYTNNHWNVVKNSIIKEGQYGKNFIQSPDKPL